VKKNKPSLLLNSLKVQTDLDDSREKFGINSPRESSVKTTDGEDQESKPTVQDSNLTVNPVTVVESVSTVQVSSSQNSHEKEIAEEQVKLRAPWRPNELLPPLISCKKGKKCLILDLDETLVHSSFQYTDCDFKIPVDIEGIVRTIYVAKRPHVDEFMKICGELFEIVVFTASLAKYADPLLDLLDVHKVIDHRLFRESCTPHCGTYVKDLFRIGRPLNQIIIIDNSPHSYAFNPQNALPCESWFEDRTDDELLDLLEMLKRLADPKVEDVMKELEALEVTKRRSNADNYKEGHGKPKDGLYEKIISFLFRKNRRS
jgi:RNA polymerase II subunit A small phosphatase-like protein